MASIIERLAQKNKDHYDEHPGRHMAFAIGYAVVAGGAFKYLIKKTCIDNDHRSV